ncbi:DsbA family protein [Haloarchaeobius iranensis]|uniref:Protein-disulfide isomerase n=1 Tax=Haloarchaeobius iranensis TaxID=996166 RepID=A0A1G9ZBG2_9EURY|nr:thioredoxin domain-containing protein [Haloarchaeobius iranensis]SDN18221.1 Protein-disulfide isomerase [Haloarchaeobius iranensis]
MDSESNITRRRALVAGGATVVFGGGVAYLASRSESSSEAYTPSTYQSLGGTTGYGVELADRPVVGERDAPVDMYYWTDYLCPFCKEFETQTLPKIGRNYIESGEVRLVFLSYPNIGQYSMPSAHWDRCVWRLNAESEPSTYWHWHGEAFEAQSGGGHDWADEETFASITERTAGITVPAVEECRQENSDAIQSGIEVDVSLARNSGVQGTPGFVLYNRDADAAGKIVGAHPYENFVDALDRVLEA